MGDLLSIVKVVIAIAVGVGLAYFWSTLNPNDSFEMLVGVGAVATVASYISLYFMGKSQG